MKKKLAFLWKIQFYPTLAQFFVTLAQNLKTQKSTENLRKKELREEKVNRTKLSLKFSLTLADFEHSVKILAGNLP